MTQRKVDFKSLSWESPMKGIRQKIHAVGPQQLRLVEYTKDLPPHWCEKDHIGYVLEGQVEIQFQDEVQEYSPGDGIWIPGGERGKHLARLLTDKARIVFVESV